MLNSLGDVISGASDDTPQCWDYTLKGWLDVLVGCIESLRGAVLHPEHHVGWKFEILAVGAHN